MLTDIEIAQSIQPKNIKEIARNAGIDEKYLEQYGNYKAKVEEIDELEMRDRNVSIIEDATGSAEAF